jgi:hypothetical protein
MTTSKKAEDEAEWGTTIFSTPEEPREDDDDPDPEDEKIAGDDEPEPEIETKLDPASGALMVTRKASKRPVRVRRSVEECEGLVAGIDDETVSVLLAVLAKEATVRGIDPTVSVTAAVALPKGALPMANVNDLWGRVVSRIDRSKRGGYRFDGSPIFGRAIFGRELSNVGVSEDGKAAPVVFGRKDMRGTLWLALAEKGASFDMAGTTIVGMSLRAWSNNSDDFERLCDVAEALIAGVEASKVTDRRTVEQKLAALDDWE